MTGCWDQVEINDRAFVMALGVDIEGGDLVVTYTFPNLQVITGNGGEGNKTYTKKIRAKTLFETNKLFGTLSQERLNFDHMKVIVLSNQVLDNKEMLIQLVDQFERNSEYARTINVFAFEGKASDVFEEEINKLNDSTIFLSKIYQNNRFDVLTTTEVSLGDFINGINNQNSTEFIPKVVIKDDEISIDGAGLVNELLFKGWINKEQIEKLSWYMGRGKGSVIPISLNDGKEDILFEVDNINTKLKFSSRNEKLVIDVEIYNEVDVTQYVMEPTIDLFDKENIVELEKKISKKVEEDTNKIIKEVQTKYKVDITNTIEKLAVSNKTLWKKYKSNWNESFSNAIINISARTEIKRIGTAK